MKKIEQLIFLRFVLDFIFVTHFIAHRIHPYYKQFEMPTSQNHFIRVKMKNVKNVNDTKRAKHVMVRFIAFSIQLWIVCSCVCALLRRSILFFSVTN